MNINGTLVNYVRQFCVILFEVYTMNFRNFLVLCPKRKRLTEKSLKIYQIIASLSSIILSLKLLSVGYAFNILIIQISIFKL